MNSAFYKEIFTLQSEVLTGNPNKSSSNILAVTDLILIFFFLKCYLPSNIKTSC